MKFWSIVLPIMISLVAVASPLPKRSEHPMISNAIRLDTRGKLALAQEALPLAEQALPVAEQALPVAGKIFGGAAKGIKTAGKAIGNAFSELFHKHHKHHKKSAVPAQHGL